MDMDFWWCGNQNIILAVEKLVASLPIQEVNRQLLSSLDMTTTLPFTEHTTVVSPFSPLKFLFYYIETYTEDHDTWFLHIYLLQSVPGN
ncbi:hypothetical protein PVAP13_6NG211006 [Panicum virgatum]|uniref:Uncharacterized protein n=1 Tax=Panicum virgatum TaxID=38727 RepID=A0A8T0QYS2_PANVG|nr:hypothetical protein PVAP13_6NG211006 [Panicum virgatum]